MVTGAHDPAAAGGDRLRAADADRERVVVALRDAFTRGRLTSEEFDARTGRALDARTRAELDAVTADLPGAPRLDDPPGSLVPAGDEAAGPSGLARRWPLASAAVKSAAYLAMALVLAYSGNLIDNSDPDGIGPGPHHGWTRFLLLLTLVLMVTALATLGRGVVAAVERRRSRKQPPPPQG